MNIFISWSGDRSKDVAILFKDWLPRVIQVLKPWISTHDIEKGSQWFRVINDQLQETTIGIVCLTQDCKNEPWILFEAGALYKGLEDSRVYTVLVDLQSTEVEGPLAQFNHTPSDKDNIFQMLQGINNRLTLGKLSDAALEESFELRWPAFNDGLQNAIRNTQTKNQPELRTDESKFDEVLEITRSIHSIVRDIETDLLQSHNDFYSNQLSAQEAARALGGPAFSNRPLQGGLGGGFGGGLGGRAWGQSRGGFGGGIVKGRPVPSGELGGSARDIRVTNPGESISLPDNDDEGNDGKNIPLPI